METGYQRSRVQEESLCYEHQKHDGSYPLIGANTFHNPLGEPVPHKIDLIHFTEDEKQGQLKRLADFHKRNAKQAPAMLKRLQQAVIENQNGFAVLTDAVRVCSLGQITQALFEVGGEYPRSMLAAGVRFRAKRASTRARPLRLTWVERLRSLWRSGLPARPHDGAALPPKGCPQECSSLARGVDA